MVSSEEMGVRGCFEDDYAKGGGSTVASDCLVVASDVTVGRYWCVGRGMVAMKDGYDVG